MHTPLSIKMITPIGVQKIKILFVLSQKNVRNMKKLRPWGFAFLLAFTLFLAITQQGHADSDRPSINANGMVRVVYFLPNDRPARPDRVAALRQLVKDAQQFYADEMHRHGFGRKTFTIEADADGEPLIHQIDGKFNEAYYYEPLTDLKVWKEFLEHFSEIDALQHAYLIAIDLSYEALDGGNSGGLAGVSFYPSTGGHGDDFFISIGSGVTVGLRGRDITVGEEALGGIAIIPASGTNFERLGLTLHELGHVFVLVHDFRKSRNSNYVMGFGSANRLSKCAAEWLSVSRFFNTKSKFRNEPGEIQLLSLRAYNQDVISLRFKVTDPDGLHQAQLLVPDILNATGWGAYRLFDCKRLNGKTGTVETVVRRAELVDRITLQIIDVGGNITWATFPIRLDEAESAQNALDVNSDGVVNISDLIPFVSRFGQRGQDLADVNENGIIDIVDVLLVAAHMPALSQQAVEMFTEADVQQWLTHAKQLEVENKILKKGIVELERLLAVLTAVTVEIPDPNLRAAIETALKVSPGTPILSSEMETLIRLEARDANIRNLTGLEGATNLKDLRLDHNAISDISVLAGLTDLTGLGLDENSISDISVLAGLTNLRGLSLYNTNISDISAIIELTDLTRLWFDWNNISDLSPLVANTGLGRGDEVYVRGNPLSYLSIHTHIPILRSKGVTVESDNRAHPALLKISGDNQKGASFVSLSQPFVVEAQDENGSALVGVSVTFAVIGGGGTLNTTITRTDPKGRAQTTLTLGPNLGTNTVEASATGIDVPVTFYAIADSELPPTTADVNNDGSVNVLDLLLITSNLDAKGTNLAADVNRDGVVSILDLILAAGMFDVAAAAPAAQLQVPEILTAVEVQGWLTEARALEVRDPIMKRGFAVLEQLLLSLTPTETELLANYPNPFNPETWIPYRLAEDAFVTLTIYDLSGQAIRTLDVGHRIAAAYKNRSKAVHWDGRNDVGEPVASGVYFYHLSAGRSGLSVPHRRDYSATRRMVILK